MKKKIVARTKSFVIPQYSTSSNQSYKIRIVITEDVDAYINKYFPEVGNESAGAAHIYKHFESYIILPFDASIGTVTHECWHAVYRIMKQIGANIENEVAAYTLGWLTEIATDFLYSTTEYKKLAIKQLKARTAKKNAKNKLTKKKPRRKL